MFNFSDVSRNLIIVSAFSALLVIWLGIRFFSEAHIQHSGAIQLRLSAKPEAAQFNIAKNLHDENALMQTLLVSADHTDEQIERLYESIERSEHLLDQALFEIDESRRKSPSNVAHKYSDESIQRLNEELKDKLGRISFLSSIIFTEIFGPLDRRDEVMRLQLFDAYVNLTKQINTLRKNTQYLPEQNNMRVRTAHSFTNSIWDFHASVSQTNILLETYIIKSNLNTTEKLNRDNLALRVFQQRERSAQALFDLSDFFKENTSQQIDEDLFNTLKTNYEKLESQMTRRVFQSISSGASPDVSLAEWRKSNNIIQVQTAKLINTAIANTVSNSEAIKKETTISFAFNTLMVLLCMAMAVAALAISKKVKHLADHDELTNIPNRRKFANALEQQFKSMASSKDIMVLITLDLNGFKGVNDTMGHMVGDKLLVEVASRLNRFIGERMTLARMGGDEFSISFTTNDPNEPAEVAKGIKALFADPFAIEDGFVKIDTSIGYSQYPKDASNTEELQTTSDFAMFNAKQSGGNCIQAYDAKMAKAFENRALIEKDLCAAIEENQLELFYQPQFNLSENAVDAVEALIRWNHPTRGMVPPFEFIDIAEEAGLMPAIGSWVLNEACRQAAEWNNNQILDIRIAINVSVHQMMQKDFVQEVFDALDRNKLDSSAIEIEITESVLIADTDWIVESLTALKERGLKIALDDFGTGYSSLSQLEKLPLDTLKIDKSFISLLDDEINSSRPVTATIASIANIYNLETVAEGVETLDQLHEIGKLGIDVAQGYYYSKPVPVSELLETVKRINSEASNKNQGKAA